MNDAYMSLIIRSSNYLRILMGWRRNGVCFLLGILATLTLPPFFLFPLLIPAFAGLFLLVAAAPTRRRAFLDGWWWGWGFYMSGLYWFCIALLTDAEKFAWLIPFALFGLTAVIAIYSGVACVIFKCTKTRGRAGIFVFSAIWMLVEFARGHLFTGFPWNLAGYSFVFSDASLQMASLVGAYGLTFFAVLLGASFALFFPPPLRGRAGWGVVPPTQCVEIPPSLTLPLKGGGNLAFITGVWGIFVLGMLWGAWRLSQAEENYVDGVTLRIVQANISQPHKWDPKLQMKGLQAHAKLTQAPGLEKITHVIWPETAVPYALQPDSSLTRMLGNAIPEKTILITGALRTEKTERMKIWNSMVALDHLGTIVGSYDKIKLVPFGEFLPFRALLPEAWTTPVGDTDFSNGTVPQTVYWPGLPPLVPLICYEVIFPGWLHQSEARPQLLLNLTNDAWFGMSTGPYQHFTMARMRAAEEGVPLVRAANTGISAVIDSYGRVLSKLELGSQGVLDSRLPRPQNTYTLYARYNTVLLSLLAALAGLLALWQRARRNN